MLDNEAAKRVLATIDEQYRGGVVTISGEQPHPEASLRFKWTRADDPRVEAYWTQRLSAVVLAVAQGASVDASAVDDGDDLGQAAVEIVNSATWYRLRGLSNFCRRHILVDDHITEGVAYRVSANAIELFAYPDSRWHGTEPPHPGHVYSGWHLAARVLGTTWAGPPDSTNPAYANPANWQHTSGQARITKIQGVGEA